MKMMKPKSEAELAEMVAEARGPLAVQGGNTRGVPIAGEVLSTSGLSGISLYEPGALTLVAGAGTPVTEIEKVLAAQNQRLAFEPADYRGLIGSQGVPTIGGVVAGNISGPRRVQVGAARDFLLGVRFVDGNGTVIRNGGRVMKNVTGYDLVKLMAGSWGTLGVLSEVALKVLPKPETSATLIWHGLGWTASLKVFCGALLSPYDVTGAARLPEKSNNPGQYSATIVRIEGFSDSVRYRVRMLKELFADLPPDRVATDGAENREIWRYVRDVKSFSAKEGNVWKTSVKPTDMIHVTEKWDYEHVVDWGGGLIWTLVPEDVDLRSEIAGVTGHSTLVRASSAAMSRLGMFQPQPAPLETISAGLRARFDPRGIFNPGLMQPAKGA